MVEVQNGMVLRKIILKDSWNLQQCERNFNCIEWKNLDKNPHCNSMCMKWKRRANLWPEGKASTCLHSEEQAENPGTQDRLRRREPNDLVWVTDYTANTRYTRHLLLLLHVIHTKGKQDNKKSPVNITENCKIQMYFYWEDSCTHHYYSTYGETNYSIHTVKQKGCNQKCKTLPRKFKQL